MGRLSCSQESGYRRGTIGQACERARIGDGGDRREPEVEDAVMRRQPSDLRTIGLMPHVGLFRIAEQEPARDQRLAGGTGCACARPYDNAPAASPAMT